MQSAGMELLSAPVFEKRHTHAVPQLARGTASAARFASAMEGSTGDSMTSRCVVLKPCAINIKAPEYCRCQRRRSRSSPSSCGRLLLLLVVQVLALKSGAEAAGWWGKGSGKAGQRGISPSDVFGDDDIDEAFRKLERKKVHKLILSCVAVVERPWCYLPLGRTSIRVCTKYSTV